MNYLIVSKNKLTGLSEKKPIWGRFIRSHTDVVITDCILDPILEVLVDESVMQEALPTSVLLVLFRQGVTDNTAQVIEQAVDLKLNLKIRARSGLALFLFKNESVQDVMLELKKQGYNELIHNLEVVSLAGVVSLPGQTDANVSERGFDFTQDLGEIDFNQSPSSLMELSQKSHWGFNHDELGLIQSYFREDRVKSNRIQRGLPQNPTWIEIECLAQSWSEHCKHKIFAAHIEYQEGKMDFGPKKRIGNKLVKGVFKTYIKRLTDEISLKKDWLLSVFHDNAGIVRFSPNVDLCIKVETHNSPSALDPFGGAMTGVLGVQRDILGTGLGAEPIANLDVFCLAPPDFNQPLPEGLHHPQFILDGVHKGVQSAGNKMGIPTVNGSFVFDAQYAGKPLVYCGTVGVLPPTISGVSTSAKYAKAGDYIVVVGGLVGKDGIHGATLSSGQMDQTTPSSMVQLGDPFTQRRVLDFLIKARDLLLFSSVTDNGAGGLSSSVGEMAQATNGAVIHLDRVLLKYPGLLPYEILISESQERMTFAVSPEKFEAFSDLAKMCEVQATHLGEFTDHGFFDFFYQNQLLGSIDLNFLHKGLPPAQLQAEFNPNTPSALHEWAPQSPNRVDMNPLDAPQFVTLLKQVLADWNVRSKKDRVEKYDQQVKGASLLRPYAGYQAGSPQCGAVISLYPYGGDPKEAVALAHGLAPKVAKWDTYTSAQWSLDECVRNLICVGVNPDKIAILDNFSWPDPIASPQNLDGSQKLAELVRAGEGLYDLASLYQTPFISGKDSMKNDFIGKLGDGTPVKISALPTVLVSGIGYVSDIAHVRGSHFVNAGDFIYLVNWSDEGLGLQQSVASEYYKIPKSHDFVNEVQGQKNWQCYQLIHKALSLGLISSIQDISEGGIVVAILEGLFGSENLGCELNWKYPLETLFSEYPGSLIVSVPDSCATHFESLFSEINCYQIGTTHSGSMVSILGPSGSVMLPSTHELKSVWSTPW